MKSPGSVQIDLVRRYARLLREEAARDRRRRFAREQASRVARTTATPTTPPTNAAA